MASKLDLILLGATGFTGKLCIKHLIDTYCNDKYSFKFGLAARNVDKLKSVLNGFTDIDEKQKDAYFELISCDSFNDEQIESMTSKTNVILTTVGPYSVYGEKLVSSCCKSGVDYVDITGEFHWVKKMIHKYQNDALNSKARIVNIAGALCSVADCAVYTAINTLNDEKSVDRNYKIKSIFSPPSNFTESGGSHASMLTMYKQDAFNDYYHPKFAYSLCPDDNLYKNTQPKMRSIFPKWNEEMKRYETCMVMVDMERMVFCRTNHLMDYCYGKEPIIEESIVSFASKYYIIALLMGILYFVVPFVLVKLTFLKCLLVKMWGYCISEPGDGPTMEKMLASQWEQYVFVESVKDKSKKRRVNVHIYGDYGYYNTSKLLIEQGIIFAMERKEHKLKEDTKFGFVTPAVAFGDKLIQRLNDLKEFDIKFE